MHLVRHDKFENHYEVIIDTGHPAPVVFRWMTLVQGEKETTKDFAKREQEHEAMMLREAALLAEHHHRSSTGVTLAEHQDLTKLVKG